MCSIVCVEARKQIFRLADNHRFAAHPFAAHPFAAAGGFHRFDGFLIGDDRREGRLLVRRDPRQKQPERVGNPDFRLLSS
jgi:hypothetical protein